MSNRIFKFRAWDKKSNVFINNVVFDIRPITIHDNKTYANLIAETNNRDKILKRENYDPEDFIIQQFTGLQDKNGREIYEGDILKLSKNNKIQYEKAVVGFHEKFLSFCIIDPPYFSFYDYEIEIIGNIFETP